MTGLSPTVTASERRCYYCGAPSPAAVWPSQERGSIVWTCADRNACTRRARQIAARRVSVPDGAA